MGNRFSPSNMSCYSRQSLNSIGEGKEVYVRAMYVVCAHPSSQNSQPNYTSRVERGTPTGIETPLVGGSEGSHLIEFSAATALCDGSLHVLECEVCSASDSSRVCRDDVACDLTLFITITPGVCRACTTVFP